MDDAGIINLFFDRSEQAIVELDNRYGGVCRKLSYNILNNLSDVEECINDSFLGVWNAIPPQRPNPLLTFVCKIVRNISIKRYRSNTAAKRNSSYDVVLDEIEACLSSKERVEEEIETKELTKIIEQFLDTLTTENRVIFMRRYWFSDSYDEISKRVGISEKNVSVRLVRIRSQLKDYLKEKEALTV